MNKKSLKKNEKKIGKKLDNIEKKRIFVSLIFFLMTKFTPSVLYLVTLSKNKVNNGQKYNLETV